MFWWRWSFDNLDSPIWIICERTSRQIWSEPVNVATSAMFLVVAALAFRRWRRNGANDGQVAILIVLTLAIGLGSVAFHTVATRAALIADILPIQLFTGLYFFLAMRRFLGRGYATSAVLTVCVYTAAILYADAVPWRLLNGYARYLSGAAILLGVAVAVLVRSRLAAAEAGLSGADARRTGLVLLTAAAVFGVSIAMAALDRPFCPTWRTGLHPLWHLLNAGVLFLMLEAAQRVPRTSPVAPSRGVLAASPAAIADPAGRGIR